MRRAIAACLLASAAAVTTFSAQAPARNFLWRVTVPGAPPVHLLGSLHVLTPEYYPLSAKIEEAFASATVLIEEADLDEISNPATMMSLAGKAMLTEGRTLDQVIRPELYKQVVERADKLGVPRAAVQRMKPWLVALSLTQPTLQAAGFKAETGVDKHFFDRAKKAGMTRRALETVAYQIDRLDQLSMPQQEALLRSTLEDLDTQLSEVKTMAAAWARGDTEVMERMLLSSMREAPEIYQRLIVERNAAWVGAVEDCIKTKTACFVVVGAGHLVGPDGLVAMLQKKGYKVEQQ